jgi:outer membrane protein
MNRNIENIRSFILLVTIVVFSTAVVAQKSWTLEECISHALQSNIQVKRSVLQEDIAQNSLTQSTFELGPSISGNYNHRYLNGTYFNQYSLKFETVENQSGNLSLSASINLFDGFSNFNNRSMLKYQLLSRRENTEILKNNITVNVVVGFLQVLFDKESLALAAKQLDISKSQLAKVESELKLGTKSQADFLNIKAQSVNNQAIYTSSLNRLRGSTIDLAQLLEIENPDEFSIVVSPIIISENGPNFDTKQLYSEISEKKPEIRKAGYDVRSAEKSVNMAYGQLSPRVSLGYSVGSGYDQSAWYKTAENVTVLYPDYTYLQQIKDYTQHVVQLSVSVPIFQRLSNFTRISQSKINLLDAKYAKEEVEKRVFKEVQSAYADVQASWDNYLSYTESVKNYQELYEQTVKRFELGMVSAIDLGLSQNNLMKAEGELLHAKYTFMLRMKILDFYKGMPITL